MNTKLKNLWSKLVNRETISYLICGVLTTVINYIANYLCYYRVDMGTFWSNIIAWVVSVIFAFFVNKIFVFQSSGWSGKQFFYELYTFMIARLLSLGFEQVFMVVTVDLLHVENWIAKLFANVFVVIMNYFASKFLIFSKSDSKKKEKSNV
jgi:putative flippase GtrA